MILNAPPKDTGVFSSTIVATIGRATLSRTVESVLSQEIDSGDFEVIVVNDSGSPLPAEKWHTSPRIVFLNTGKRNQVFASNAAAAIARGRYLHFLDDDDWLLPGAFRALWSVARAGNASLVCGATKFVDSNGTVTGESFPEVQGDSFVRTVAGPWIPLQSSFIETGSYIKAGGIDNRFVQMGQQKDLCRRIAFFGDFANTRHVVSCVVRDRKNSTAHWELENAASLRSRDYILDERGAFARMVQSAKSPYWRGRLVRAYLTCVFWNLKNTDPFKMLSRACAAAAGCIISIPNMLSMGFWRGMLDGN